MSHLGQCTAWQHVDGELQVIAVREFWSAAIAAGLISEGNQAWQVHDFNSAVETLRVAADSKGPR